MRHLREFVITQETRRARDSESEKGLDNNPHASRAHRTLFLHQNRHSAAQRLPQQRQTGSKLSDTVHLDKYLALASAECDFEMNKVQGAGRRSPTLRFLGQLI